MARDLLSCHPISTTLCYLGLLLSLMIMGITRNLDDGLISIIHGKFKYYLSYLDLTTVTICLSIHFILFNIS